MGPRNNDVSATSVLEARDGGFYLNGCRITVRVNRHTGTVRVGCHTMSLETLRKLAAAVERAYQPVIESEVDVVY